MESITTHFVQDMTEIKKDYKGEREVNRINRE